MQAIVLHQYGGPEVLQISEVPTPKPGADEVLVRVVGTALNRADLMQRMGMYPPPEPRPPFEIPGLECSGLVEEIGKDVKSWKPGDRVMALLPGGGYAEYVTVPSSMLMPVPENLDLHEAAAIPEVFLTAYDALFHQGELQKGEKVLIHAGGSGVGTAAIQLAVQYGAWVSATVGSLDKIARIQELGAQHVVHYRSADFVEEIKRLVSGVDLVLDFVGGPYLQRNMDVCNQRGRIVQIGLLGGARGEIDLNVLLFKRLKLIGTALRYRPLEEKIALTQKFIRTVLPLFAQGQIKPVIDRILPLSEVAEAHRTMAENLNFGKIVLAVGEI